MSAETIHTSDLADAAQRWRRKKTPHIHWEISPHAATLNSLLNFLSFLWTVAEGDSGELCACSFYLFILILSFFCCTHSVPNCMFVSNAELIPTGRLSRNRFLSSPSVRKGQTVSWAALQLRGGGGEEREEEDLRWTPKSLWRFCSATIMWLWRKERFACLLFWPRTKRKVLRGREMTNEAASVMNCD